jgi:hypothetical protein
MVYCGAKMRSYFSQKKKCLSCGQWIYPAVFGEIITNVDVADKNWEHVRSRNGCSDSYRDRCRMLFPVVRSPADSGINVEVIPGSLVAMHKPTPHTNDGVILFIIIE